MVGRQTKDLLAAILIASTCCLLSINCVAKAQDILRQQRQQQQPASNPLANIQLPPQLASLTPQQLHQLAQLRELQLQQQAVQQAQQDNQANFAQDAPAPIGIEALNQAPPQQQPQPTSQPANLSGSQIPQPNAASGQADSNDRHDDGAYNESGSEMEGVAQPAEPSQAGAAAQSGSQAAAAAPTFEVNWNKCPQLEPSEVEKNKKTQVITKCLQSAPIPTNLTRENVEAHREQIATCALKVEGWFDDGGNYKYDKAEQEIKGKKLDSAIELQVLKFHVACKDEASKKFPRDQNKLIDQVQFYQACMDYYISIVCEIEVSVDQ